MRSTLLLTVALMSCVHATPQRLIYEPSTNPPAAPPAWSKVRLVATPVATEPVEPDLPFTFHASDAIEQELGARLSPAGEATLRVREARAIMVADRLGSRLGIAATFEIAGETLRLEHSVNVFEVDTDNETRLVTLAVRDLCDRLLHHPDALAALAPGAATPPYVDPWIDTGAGVGPVLAVQASTEDVDASGRLVWPTHERSNVAAASFVFGEAKGFRGEFLSTRRFLENGFGYRAGGSILVLSVPVRALGEGGGLGNIFGDDGVFFGGGRLSVAGEWGMAFVGRSLEGYVLTPGPRVSVVPQMSGTAVAGTGAGGTLVLWALEAGVAGEVDVPMGDSVGLSGGAFAGVTYAAFTGSAHSDSGIPMFAWYPYARVYYQSARGRLSLGVSFETLTQAALRAGGGGAKAAGMLGTAVVTLAYDGRTGRGLAYRGSEPNDDLLAVKSTPLPAFATLVEPSAPAVDTVAAAAPTVAAPAPVTPKKPPPKRAGRWVVLLSGADALLGADGTALVAKAIGKVLHQRGARVVAAERTRGTLAVLGVREATAAQLADIVDALEVDHALLVELSGSDADAAFSLHRFDASGGAFEPVHETMTRTALLRELRAAAAALFDARAP